MSTEILPTLHDSLDAAAASLPYGFLEAVADHGDEALSSWLKANAPEDVFELFECLRCVKIQTDAMLRGVTGQRTDLSLFEYVATIARVSDDLGIDWHGCDGGKITARPNNAAPQPA